MKGNVFSKWLQEFCSLVFVQTIQAFILAMIMTIIVSAMTNGKSGGSLGDSDILYSTGVLAIIALASISKVEALVKKIFGLEGGLGDKASMREGKGGVLGSLVAFKMAKRAFNNLPKVITGSVDHHKASSEEKRTKLNYANKINNLDQRYGLGSAAGGAGAAAAAGVAGVGSASGGAGGAGSAAGTGAAGNANNIAYEEKREKMLEEYNSKINEIKKQKRDANRTRISGVTETLVGLGGMTAGMVGKGIVDGAAGDASLKGILEAGGVGLGAGDKLGENMVKLSGYVSETVRTNNSLRKDVKKYKSRQTDIENTLKKINVDAGNFD